MIQRSPPKEYSSLGIRFLALFTIVLARKFTRWAWTVKSEYLNSLSSNSNNNGARYLLKPAPSDPGERDPGQDQEGRGRRVRRRDRRGRPGHKRAGAADGAC